MMFDEIARAIGTERLLLGNGRQGEAAGQIRPQGVKPGVDGNDGRSALFHVAAAGAEHLAVYNVAAEGISRPSFGGNGREGVDMAVEDEVGTRSLALKRAEKVRHGGIGVDDPIG